MYIAIFVTLIWAISLFWSTQDNSLSDYSYLLAWVVLSLVCLTLGFNKLISPISSIAMWLADEPTWLQWRIPKEMNEQHKSYHMTVQFISVVVDCSTCRWNSKCIWKDVSIINGLDVIYYVCWHCFTSHVKLHVDLKLHIFILYNFCELPCNFWFFSYVNMLIPAFSNKNRNAWKVLSLKYGPSFSDVSTLAFVTRETV